MPDITIREATSEDAPTLGRLGAALVAAHHAFDPQRFFAATPQTASGYGRYLASQVGQRDVLVLVAERDGTVLGYSYAGNEDVDYMALRGPAGVIYDVLVEPAYRGEGIGKALLDATLARLQLMGAPRVVLSTAARNEAAQRFFTRAGFRPTMIEMTREADGG